MPRLSVWMVRTALVQLAAGFLLGALMLGGRSLGIAEIAPRIRPLHAELLLLGWTVQLALGVAFWILPRFRTGPERGREWPAWLAFALLNLGVLVSGAALAGALPRAWAVAGRAAEVLAAASFAAHAWPRVKPFG